MPALIAPTLIPTSFGSEYGAAVKSMATAASDVASANAPTLGLAFAIILFRNPAAVEPLSAPTAPLMLARMDGVLPYAPVLANSNSPPFTVVLPLYVLAPVTIIAPVPDTVSPPSAPPSVV